MRPAHHDGDASGAYGIGHSISACNHARHRAYADEPYFFMANELDKLLLIHGTGVAVNQEHFVA